MTLQNDKKQPRQKSLLDLITNLFKIATENKVATCALALTGYSILRHQFLNIYRWYYKLPPGPNGLPFFGVTPMIVLNMISQRKYFNNMGNTRLFSKYGGIVSWFNRSSVISVQLNDGKLCQQILKNKNVLDRPKSFKESFGLLNDPKSKSASFVSLNDKEWMIRRKYAQTALTKVSTNKFLDMVINQCMYDTIFNVLNKIIDGEKNIVGNEDDINNDGLWYPRKIVSYIAFRTIFHSNFGHKIDYSDRLHHDLINITRKQAAYKPLMRVVLLSLYKPLRYIKPLIQPYYDWTDERNQLIDEIIKKRLNSKEYNVNKPQSYIDHVIKLEKNGKLSRNELILDVYLFFLAGSETTSNNLEQGIIHLCNNINIQNQVRNELMKYFNDKNEKGYRDFCLKKLYQLPLHRALIHEILRISTVVPDGVQHMAKKEIKVDYNGKEYIIPKNATIIYNEWYIHKISNNENWKINNDKILCLDNWLKIDKNTNKKIFINNDSHVTFGLGRRDCIGKNVAIKEMASVLGYLLLNYKFSFKNKNDADKINQNQIGFATLNPQIGVKVERI